jgi:hypothetical protein
MFYDSWSTSPIDTTEKWTTTGTAPTIAGGNMTMAATAGYHAIRTKDVVRPNAGFTYVANGITLEGATAGTGATRFWGLGLPATTPTATSMAQEGAGFEIDATGTLYAVTYTGGVRTAIAPLTRPTDGVTHRFAMYFRVTGVMWYIDDLQIPVASKTFPNVAVVELPALIARFNGTLANSPLFTNIAHLTADTLRQGNTIIDPVIGTRQARVTAGGALAVAQRGTETTGVATGNIFVARSATVGTSAAVLQAAPATGLSLYVTDVSVSNSGASLSVVSLLPTAGTAFLDIVAAASGGGGSMNFRTPVKLAANTGLSVIASVASTSLYCTVTGYTA